MMNMTKAIRVTIRDVRQLKSLQISVGGVIIWLFLTGHLSIGYIGLISGIMLATNLIDEV